VRKTLAIATLFVLGSMPVALARGGGSTEYQTTCFFNGAGEPCIVDTRNGGLHVTYMRDGKKIFYTVPAGLALVESKPGTVIDGSNSYTANVSHLVRGWDDNQDGGPAYQFKTINGTTIIPQYVY